MPNAIAINILDSAQLDPGYVCELVERFDMAQVTVIEATHQKEAWATAQAIQKRRGDKTDIFYRRWREHLPDERMVAQTTPEEFVRYMQDVMEAGFVASVYNEAQQIPMTPLTNYSVEVIERTTHKGWRTVHFKTSTGTPRGYKGEQPDGYAESDALWRAAVQANKAAMDAGEKPLVHVAPHAYFPIWGKADGHTDRPLEIVRRLKQLELDPRYLPISIGETGLIEMTRNGQVTDAEGGWRKVLNDAVAYARLYAEMASVWAQLGIVSHLFGAGDQQTQNNVPGKWYNFDLLKVAAFWDELELAANRGVFDMVVKPVVIVPKPESAIIGTKARVKFTNSTKNRNLRSEPRYDADYVGDVVKDALVCWYAIPHTTGVINPKGETGRWVFVEVLSETTPRSVTRQGWMWDGYVQWDSSRVTTEVPIVTPDEPPGPQPPPPDVLVPPPAKEPEQVITMTPTQLETLIDMRVAIAMERFFMAGLLRMSEKNDGARVAT